MGTPLISFPPSSRESKTNLWGKLSDSGCLYEDGVGDWLGRSTIELWDDDIKYFDELHMEMNLNFSNGTHKILCVIVCIFYL